MTADREALVAEVAGILAEHEYDVHVGGTVRPACKCGWVADLEWSSTHVYDLHVADALADLLAAREQQARAEAWDEGWDEGADDVFGKGRSWNPYREATP